MKTSDVEYAVDGTQCRAYCVEPEAQGKKLPGILMYPDFWGINARQKKVAQKWANMGAVVVVADMYGNQETGKTFEDSGHLMQSVTKDENIYKKRMLAAYEVLKKNPNVDTSKLFSIGYCWGGATALHLARITDDLKGIISVHGLLHTKTRVSKDKKMPKMLILNGARDKMVTDADIRAFQDEMIACNADFTFVSFGLSTHAFTNEEAAGNDVVAYNAIADQRTDYLVREFFNEQF